MVTPLSLNETVPPFGRGDTVAVKVTSWPAVDGLAEDRSAVEVEVGEGPVPVSTAPLSQLDLPWAGRGSPRWSVETVHAARGTLLIAALPGAGNIVWVGPPLFPSEPSVGFACFPGHDASE